MNLSTATTWTYVLGFTAQGLFSARMLIQWVLSEKSKKVVSPTIYWQLSILASFLFFIYGWLRNDFAIILGQIFSYYIYIWNLDNKGFWKKMHVLLRTVFLLTPAIAITLILYQGDESVAKLFREMPTLLLIYGSLGQIIFTLRFIYQWWYSKSRAESSLPTFFWILSLLGSIIIVSYGVFRMDFVLMLGHCGGLIIYSRNLYLCRISPKSPSI
ncbi:lipid-A-disaccharide synthase N-terminal domain-containing protein [Porphyromonadaceae bacterium OttesenSCG-928-L07]|nr:lipid-A-disaccharide synthase N-terminal domain-containing protein [Porphyromonadaceae bacterium OttesenSCG-928-L07]